MLKQFKKTEEQLAQKIYPQKNNIPYINPHGQYAVKLKFLGNYYKVIIDDYFPIDILNRQSLFAKEQHTNNIWSFLITKAILKFYYFKFHEISLQSQNQNSSLLYNGDIIYSLCGMQLMQFKNKQIRDLQWDYFVKTIQQKDLKDLYQIAVLKSNDIQKVSRKITQQRGSRFKSIGSTVFFLRKNQKFKKHHQFVDDILSNEKEEKIEVPKGQLFGVQDIFQNKGFNMAYVQEVTEKELITRKKYGQVLMQKTQFMSKEDIIELKRKRREFKMTIKEFEKQLVEKIKKNTEYKLINISNGLCQNKTIQMQQEFVNKQIQIAQLCKLKNLSKPPNYKNLLDMKFDDNSVQTTSNHNKQYKDFGENTQTLYKNTFSNFDNLDDLQISKDKSVWLEHEKLQEQFDNVFVYFNPKAFKNIENILKASDKKSIEMDQNKEILVIYKDENHNNNSQQNICINFQTDSVNTSNFLLIQQYDFNKFEPIKTFDELNLQNQSLKIKTADRNQVFRFTLNSLDNYKISIYSERKFELMSIATYLTKIERWNEKTYNVNVDFINQKVQNYFFKLQINISQSQNFIIRNKCSDYLKNFLDFQILQKNQETEECVDLQVDTYTNFNLQPGQHILIIKSMTSMNIKGESFDIQIFSQQDIQCQEITLNKNRIYFDVIKANKYQQIAKENLFFTKDELNLSYYFSLKKLNLQQDQDEKQKAQKKFDIIQVDQIENVKLRIYIILNIYLDNNLVLQKKGVNKIEINDLVLKKENKQYYTIELLFQKNQILNQNILDNLVWVMNLTPNDNIVLTKNIQKQKENQALIQKWFQNDPKKQAICKVISQRNNLLCKQYKEKLSETELNDLKNYEIQIKQYYNPETQTKGGKKFESQVNLVKEDKIDINQFETYDKDLQKIVEDFKCARIIEKSTFGPKKVFDEKDKQEIINQSIMQKEQIKNLKEKAKNILENILKEQEQYIQNQKKQFIPQYDENIDITLNQIKKDFNNYNRDLQQQQKVKQILQDIQIENNEQIDLTLHDLDIEKLDYKTKKFIEILNKNAKIKNLENKIEQALQENNQKQLKELQNTLQQTDLQIDDELLIRFEENFKEIKKKQLIIKIVNKLEQLENNFQSLDEFYILEEIGHGAFSKVHLTLHKITHKIYALKVIDIKYNKQELEDQLFYEIKIHSELHHENIIQIHGFFRHKNKLCLVLEYIKDGNLYKFLKHQKVLTGQQIAKIFKQIVLVLNYLHSNKIIYRDLKPENILINKENYQVKLCDFGWAIKIYDQKGGSSKAGTYAYMAPESLKVEKQTYASDIWSLGVLLYELFFNKEPFEDESLFNHLLKMKNQEIDFSSREIPLHAQDLIRSLLFYEQNERLTIQEILDHPFLKPQSHSRNISSQQSLQLKNSQHFLDRDVRKTEKSSLLNISSFREKLNGKKSKNVSGQQKQIVVKPRKISISNKNKNKSLQRRPIRLQNQLHTQTQLRNVFSHNNLLKKYTLNNKKKSKPKNQKLMQQDQRNQLFQQNLRKNSMDRKQDKKQKVQFFTLERNIFKRKSTETEFNSTAFETYDNIKKQRQKMQAQQEKQLLRKQSSRRVLKLKPNDKIQKQKILKMKLEVRKEFNQLRQKQKKEPQQIKESISKHKNVQSTSNLKNQITPKKQEIHNKLKYLKRLIKNHAKQIQNLIKF